MLNLGRVQKDKDVCLAFVVNDTILWHKILRHISMKQTAKLLRKDLVKGLPKINYVKNRTCEACQDGKVTSRQAKPLDLLYMDNLDLSLYIYHGK